MGSTSDLGLRKAESHGPPLKQMQKGRRAGISGQSHPGSQEEQGLARCPGAPKHRVRPLWRVSFPTLKHSPFPSAIYTRAMPWNMAAGGASTLGPASGTSTGTQPPPLPAGTVDRKTAAASQPNAAKPPPFGVPVYPRPPFCFHTETGGNKRFKRQKAMEHSGRTEAKLTPINDRSIKAEF